LINYKDTLFKKPMYQFKPLRKIHEGITKFWLKIGRSTVENSHLNVAKQFNKMCSSLEGGEQVQALLKQLDADVVRNLGGVPLKGRLDSIYTSLDALEEFFLKSPIKTLFNKEAMAQSLTKFRANDMIIAPRNNATAAVEPLKQSCTQIMQQLKAVTNPTDHKKLEAFEKRLQKTLKLEADSYFNKVRDLRVGAAPTDVTSVLTTTAGAGWAMLQCEDKDTRISVALKYGIPIIGASIASPLIAAGLISGFNATLAGIASGFVFNRIGAQVDQLRKQHFSNQPSAPIS
jgi:hypothetical protein